jgi:hypothetical protein
VTGLRGTCIKGVLQLTWDEVDAPDVAGYEIKAGPRWTGGLPVARVSGSRFVALADWIGDRTFRVKAVNRLGIVSDYEATVDVSNDETFHEVNASADEHPTWGGTKTDVAVDRDCIVLDVPTLTGSYESAVLSATGLDAWRVVISVETDIVDVDLVGSRIQVAGDSPYLQRKMGDELGAGAWEGSENNEIGPADALPMPGDDMYLSVGDALSVFDFQRNGVSFLIEYRTSDDGGSTWTDWATYQPVVATCDALQARVTLTSVHADLVPRICSMTLHLLDPVVDSSITHS